jgi:hypothetical protein
VTDNDGTPVPGVVVTIYRWMAVLDPGLAVITDDRGFYSMSFPSAAGISILVSKNGYASGWHTHLIGGEGDFQLDVRIYRMPKTAGN